MTLPEFSEIFAVLAIQLRATDADEATIRGYFEALNDLDVAFFRAAADRLRATAEWFPKTSEWRITAAKIEAERREQQRAWRLKAHRPLCKTCDDTGWELVPLVEDGKPVTRAKTCACKEQRWRELTGQADLPALPAAVLA